MSRETDPEALMADAPGATLRIRLATRADIAALVALMREFYAESGYPLDEAWAAEAFGQLIDDPSKGAAWLIEELGKPIGHVVLSVRFAMEFGGLLGYIDDIYVQPARRGRGAATAALATLGDACRTRGCRAIEVEVAPDNRPAQAAYRRLGMAPGSDDRQHLRLVLAPPA